MTAAAIRPERIRLAPEIEISRALTGLWQVADIEKDGAVIDPEEGAGHLQAYVRAGFDSFDMADHYGSAEIIAGRLLKRGDAPRPTVFTKWCPPPGAMTADVVRAGVEKRLARLDVGRIDLLQFHWWMFEHPAWLDALHELSALRDEGLIGELGVTNFDAAHFNLALADGIPLRTNQVSMSLLDARPCGPLTEVCEAHGTFILAYGVLCGGFLSDRWLGKPEPTNIADWSKMKYKRFIDATGGWDVFQELLAAMSEVARKHNASIANVATRWVLEQPRVAGVIIGARLGENAHIEDNLKLFSFALDADDKAALADAMSTADPLPGDCGDEYRKPPFLTATGDLSHHLTTVEKAFTPEPVATRDGATRVTTGSVWEDIAGYCRAHRIGDRIFVSGTTAVAGVDRAVAVNDAGAQTTYILDRILTAIAALGGKPEDVVRTRVYIVDDADTEAVARAHGRVFGEIKPANTFLRVAGLVGDHRVEIDAEAVVAG
jgi:aryl-alcohol dehydrogenase-like predicted oxidoreductase/enamine deaminase RidA (YjgF/YER057c/UK114 family)